MLLQINEKINSLCGPSYLYFVFSITSLALVAIIDFFSKNKYFSDKKSSFKYYISRLIFICIFTFILNWLCSKGYINFSWFLLYFPYIFLLVVVIGVIFTINNMIKNNEIMSYINKLDKKLV